MTNDSFIPQGSEAALPYSDLILLLMAEVQKTPYQYNLYSLLKQLDGLGALYPDSKSSERVKIRLGQDPSLKFATSSIQTIEVEGKRIAININGFGLLGVNAPLPLHFTEYVFERKHQYGDTTWLAFINMLQHRLILLFYQAWDKAQSVNSLNKPHTEDFSRYLASFTGLNLVDLKTAEEQVAYYAKLYYTGLYIGERRSAKNLETLLGQYFHLPTVIEEYTGYWQAVDKSDITILGKKTVFKLGDGLLCGDKIFDLQNKFRIVIGPMDLSTYKRFFKGHTNHLKLVEWVNLYIGYEFKWDIQLILKQPHIPQWLLGENNQLGLTTWLGVVNKDANDLIIGNS